jgi:hypothetical protein
MAKQTIKTTTTTKTTYRKSASGQKHCPVCGKFMKKK